MNNLLKGLEYSEDARGTFEYINSKYSDKYEVIWIESKATDTQGFLIHNKKSNIVKIAFRGTQQLRDWATDFNAFHMVYPYGNENTKIRVHQGIYKAYCSIRSIIHAFFLCNSNLSLVEIDGHSLGGALAKFAAVDIQYNFSNQINIIRGYTSGAPKIGNSYFAESFNRRCPFIYNTYKHNDWVPYLPPKWFGKIIHKGYSKAGILNPIGKRNFLLGFLNWYISNRKLNKLLENTANHSIEAYRKDLESLDIENIGGGYRFVNGKTYWAPEKEISNEIL